MIRFAMLLAICLSAAALVAVVVLGRRSLRKMQAANRMFASAAESTIKSLSRMCDALEEAERLASRRSRSFKERKNP